MIGAESCDRPDVADMCDTVKLELGPSETERLRCEMSRSAHLT